VILLLFGESAETQESARGCARYLRQKRKLGRL
jgi:hypothetical protein